MICNFSGHIETGGLLGVMGSYRHCKGSNISKVVQNSDVVATDHWKEVMCGLSDCAISNNFE